MEIRPSESDGLRMFEKKKKKRVKESESVKENKVLRVSEERINM